MITRRSQRGLNKKEKEHEGGIGTTPIESPVVGSMALASTPPTSKLGNSVVADPPSLSSSNDETSNSIRKNNPNNMQNTNTAANDSSNNNNSSAEMPVAAAPAATNAGRRSSSRLIRSSPKDSSSSSSPKKKKNTKKLGTPNTTAAEASSSTTKRKTRSDSPAAASASSATTTRNLDGTTGIPKGGATKISLLHPKDPPNGSSAGDEPDDTEGAKQQCETNTNKGPKYLDESTLAWMKRHLDDKASNNNTDGRSVSLLLADALDEDEVMDLSIRLAHQAHERTRQATARVNSSSNMRSPVSTPEPAAAADSEDDDPGSDDMSLFEECLEEEEDQALGHELFKKVVTIAAQQQRPSSTLETPVGPTCHKDDNNKNNNKANSGQENQILDKKTLSWIKRAAGLHRSDVRNIIKNADGSRGRSTRLHTRNQVKDSRRNHKKRERGLDILIVAIADLEDEYGPFPNRILRKTAREKKKSRRAKEADMEEAKSTAANNKNNSKRKRKAEIVELVEPKGRRKQAKLAHKKESKEPKTKTVKPKKQVTKREPTKSPSSGKKGDKCKGIVDSPSSVCTSLRILDTLWRDQTKQCYFPEDQVETPAEYRVRNSIPLHPQFVSAGIVHRLPRMQTLARPHENPTDTPSRVYDPPRSRHTNKQYAELCRQLMHCLQGPARLFVTCEFFYSDLDREWYNHNPFAEQALKIGVPVDAQLTWDEWRTVRRHMQKKPRRFSRNFINSQLNARNKYRCAVRSIQNNPHLVATSKFSYRVFSPIQVGSTVTAYSKRFRIIQRGRVMSFDCSAALYLIQFENKNFGFELCPDSDVSTSGLPDVMFSPRQRAEVGLLDTFCSGSSTGHIPAGLHLPPKECDVLSQLVKFSPTSSRTTAKPSSVIPMCLLDEVANLGAFVLLLEVIDIALARKKQLLNLIEKVNSNVSEKNSLSPQINNGVRLSHVTEDHFLWIRANIERTDQVLFAALEYLRTLYGETYLSPAIIRNRSLGQKDRLQSLDGYLNRKSMQQTCASDWTDNIVAQADDVGYLVASKVMVKAIRPTVVHDDLRDRFTAASQLACTLAYAMDTTTRNPPNELYPAIAVATAWLTASIFPSEDRSHPFYDEILDARDTAANDLNEAVNLLVAELRLSQEVS